MTEGIDYTSRDYQAFKQLLIQKLQEKMPEYTDTSETDAGIVILEALANGLDILSLYLDIIANDVILPTTQDRSIAVILAGLLGYHPYNQTASIIRQVFVIEGQLENDTIIPKGTVVRTEESVDEESILFETMDDLVIPAGSIGNEKDEQGNYVYSVLAEQGSSIQDDILGTSSGSPLQTFDLNYPEVLIDSIELYVDEGLGAKLWTRVDSFINSTPDSLVYRATLDEFDVCTIEFGDGLKGKIPTSYANGISANYRVGGGEVGNVSENTVVELETQLPYIAETFNVELVTRGHEKEELESIKENAPAMFRSKDRLVTLEDYNGLLKAHFYDLLDVTSTKDLSNKKLVHLYYMMREDYKMTPSLISAITEFITDRCMVGTSFDLSAYTEQKVDIVSTLYVKSDYPVNEIKEEVEDYLRKIIFYYGELKFGDSIITPDLESAIKEDIEGVASFRITSPSLAIISPDAPNKVLSLGTLTINTVVI